MEVENHSGKSEEQRLRVTSLCVRVCGAEGSTLEMTHIITRTDSLVFKSESIIMTSDVITTFSAT